MLGSLKILPPLLGSVKNVATAFMVPELNFKINGVIASGSTCTNKPIINPTVDAAVAIMARPASCETANIRLNIG